MNIFKIVFKHVVGNSCMVPIAPISATNFNHMTLFWGKTHIFKILDSTPKRDACFCFGKWFGYMRTSKPYPCFSIHGKVFKI